MTGLALVGGAVAGSAAGAAMHRWPTGATMLHPRRSACADCGTVLGWRDLVPVVSWLVLRGRCRACGVAIDRRIPALEVTAAVIAAIVLREHGPTLRSVVIVAGAVAVVVAALIDAEHRIVPDRLSLPLGAFALMVVPMLVGRDRVTVVLLWAIGLPLGLRMVILLADRAGLERPVGAGDVKLLVGVLALAGTSEVGPQVVLIGSVILAGLVATVGLLTGRLGRRARLPFAPALAAPLLLVLLAPDRVANIVRHLGGAPWLS